MFSVGGYTAGGAFMYRLEGMMEKRLTLTVEIEQIKAESFDHCRGKESTSSRLAPSKDETPDELQE